MNPVRTQKALNVHRTFEASTDYPMLAKGNKSSEVLTG